MANDFSADSSCKALWQFEPGENFLADSIGENAWDSYTDEWQKKPVSDAVAYKEGSGSSKFWSEGEDVTTTLYADSGGSELASDFPIQNGKDGVFSVACWMKFNDPGEDFYQDSVYLFGFGSLFYLEVKNPYVDGYSSDDAFIALMLAKVPSGSSYIDANPGDIPGNTWIHVGVAIDSTNLTYLVRFSPAGGTPYIMSGSLVAALRLGSSTADFWVCQTFNPLNMDELAVFDRALTEEEFEEIENGSFPSASPTQEVSASFDSLLFSGGHSLSTSINAINQLMGHESVEIGKLIQQTVSSDTDIDGLKLISDQLLSTDLDAVFATASIAKLDAVVRSRFAILKVHEMSALDVGINKSDGGEIVYRSADNVLEDDAAPVQIPEPGDLGYSFTKTLRPYLLVSPGGSVVSNLRWYSGGINGFGQGIRVVVKNLGVTWTENVNGEFPGTLPFFNFVPSHPINGDSVDTGPFDSSDEGTYIGDLIRLQMIVDSSAQPGHTPIEYLTLAYDEQ
jgi:hypothetical protein